ncbi:translocation/assembly module TamB domain-containing protein [Phenylobacterium sp.]|uniref:translocation/assembly module TamB domain-containing protein n=1 Tax=Phenylobacterium sp. TaxID=1871053 RepID=UPI0025CE2CFD|nr:translocation/assembly module TamB domain-containing protein [Phenylobacterium sp.]
MSTPSDTPPSGGDGGEGAVAEVLKRPALPKAITAVALSLLVLLVGALAVGRYGVLLPQVRLLIEARTDGLKLGRIGRLKVEGLSGDIWRDARVRRLTIRDEKGVWLEANNVHITWRYLELLRRRFDADLIEAQSVRVIRRPTLAPKGKDRGLPVSFHIDEARTRLVLEPAFSSTRGVYDLGFDLDMERKGGRRGKVQAASVLHPGDRLHLDFAFGAAGPMRIVADAVEAKGGALAGAAGLPHDQPFRLAIRADGTVSTGQFSATATSGRLTPLYARGQWTPQGGQAGGRVLLVASSLTAPYAERVGRDVVFGIAGRKARPGAYALDARLKSNAVTLRAWGEGDLGKRALAPSGMRLDAQTASLNKLLGGGPGLGATRVTGLVTGQAAAWTFRGNADVADVTLGSYVLARVAGPVEVARGKTGLAVKAKAQGGGGRGEGFAAALLGGAPVAELDGERLSNGQLLLRRLDLTGRGLKVQASGDRSLLGAVNFKGKANISNLQAARLGANGAASLDVQASQAGSGAPWTFTLDARGDRFAVGLAELDRLLGGKPRLQAQANWQAGRLSVAKASLAGASLDANAAGVMEADRSLAFKADWTATGPVRAGPVEITGRIEGTGDATGTLSAPRLDLVADLEQVDVPRLPLKDAKLAITFQRQADGSNGTAAITAGSEYGPARAKADFRFPRGGVDLSDLFLDAGGVKASGTLSLRSSSPSAADLRLEIVHGAFLDAGRVTGTAKVVDGAGGARADLSLRAEAVRARNSAITIQSARLEADGPLARLPYTVQARGASGQGAWTVDGRGALSDSDAGYELAFDGRGALGKRNLQTTETASFRFGGAERSARVRLAASDGGKLDFDGLLRDGVANVRARAQDLGLNLFNADLDGRVNATLALQGQGDRLQGNLDAQLADARGRGTPVAQGMDGSLTARLADSSVALEMATANEQGLKANASFVLPAEASASPFRVAIARQRPMRGHFFAAGEVRPLWELLVGGERSLSGFVRTEASVSGTLADPRASGNVTVDKGRFDDGGTGLSLREVTVRAAFTEDDIDVTEASGVDGKGGQVSGRGRMSLLREGASSFRLDLRNFRLIDNETATASATGRAVINRAADGKVKLSGDLTIDRADVAADPPTPSGVVAMDVREINRPDDLPAVLPATAKRGQGWTLDVNLRAPRRVFLRGRGLDVELSLDAHVGGTTSRPDLSGTAHVVRGDYDFAGKRFEFDDRSVVYLSTRPANIRLQLDATREDPSLTVTVRIRGTAERPEITLVSSPSLPNDEVLSKVLFERSASQLSPVEAAQLASALSALAGGGGFDVIGNLRNFAGLDRLAFGGDDQSGVTVSGGKYLTDDVYLELTGGGREGPSAQVEWRIRKNLSILSRLTSQNAGTGTGNRVAVRWRKDY